LVKNPQNEALLPLEITDSIRRALEEDVGSGDVTTNKLGNRVFLRFDNTAARLVAIQIDGAANGAGTTFATDPDVFVLGRGALVQVGVSTPPGAQPHSTAGHETIAQFALPAGTFILEVYDFEMSLVANPQPRCMTVALTGN